MIRLGYVSPDYRIHSAAFAFTPVLWAHNRKRFHVTCYSDTLVADPMTVKCRAMADAWVECYGVSDRDLVERIKADRIDVLIDLAGHTANTRLPVFTAGAAPVVCSGWGYIGAPGIPGMVHFADPVLIPPAERSSYAERIWDLPATFHYQPPDGCPDPSQLPALRNGHVTFGYLGRWTKVTRPVLDVWGAVLRNVPDSRLILKDKAFQDPKLRQDVMHRLGTERRVSFLPMTAHIQHLDAYRQVDIALDPWPMGGGVTTLEAAWMGVPSVTLYGDRPSSRASSSIMTALGLQQLVAQDLDSYIAAALDYARMPLSDRVALRARLRDRMMKSPLCDTPRYVAAVEQAYTTLLREAGRG